MTGHQRERQADLKNRFAALLGTATPAAAPKPTTEPRPAKKRTPRQTAPGGTGTASTPVAAPPTVAPATPSASPPVAAMPLRQAETDEARPKRLMVPLSLDEDRALKEMRVADGVPAAARLRAMLQLYRTDDRYRRRVDQTVRAMRTH